VKPPDNTEHDLMIIDQYLSWAMMWAYKARHPDCAQVIFTVDLTGESPRGTTSFVTKASLEKQKG